MTSQTKEDNLAHRNVHCRCVEECGQLPGWCLRQTLEYRKRWRSVRLNQQPARDSSSNNGTKDIPADQSGVIAIRNILLIVQQRSFQMDTTWISQVWMFFIKGYVQFITATSLCRTLDLWLHNRCVHRSTTSVLTRHYWCRVVIWINFSFTVTSWSIFLQSLWNIFISGSQEWYKVLYRQV